MEKQTRRSARKGVLSAAVVLVLMVLAFLLGFSVGRNGMPQEPVNTPAVITASPEATATPEITPEPTAEPKKTNMYMTEEGEICIETEYVTLYYPAEYAADVMIDVAEETDGYTLTVSSTLNNQDIELYALVLSKAQADGYYLGNMQNGAGVYMLMHEQNPADWSPEEFDRINVLQESVNTLLMQIYESEGFAAAK